MVEGEGDGGGWLRERGVEGGWLRERGVGVDG